MTFDTSKYKCNSVVVFFLISQEIMTALLFLRFFFSENGSAAHMTHHCTVYYRDVLVTVPGGVTFISLLVLLSTMSSIGGRSGWKGTVCPPPPFIGSPAIAHYRAFFFGLNTWTFFCPVRYVSML